jgi:para-nitrobenzyl esterase
MQTGARAACVLAITGLLLGFSALAHAGSLTVKTEQGKVRGKIINGGKVSNTTSQGLTRQSLLPIPLLSHNPYNEFQYTGNLPSGSAAPVHTEEYLTVRAFLGLPYAAPPVGDLRWKAPQPPASWKDERDATSFGTHCAQNRIWDDMTFEDSGASEDCLFLNIYTPAEAGAKSKLPVMFWIHGGGYAAGASSEPRHNGDFLPLKGVVLVTINYRLGVFGFLATSDLAKEANGAAGNYGLLDMVAALEWVKANIRNFGGDPDNVTIFGESAGSFAVSTLMASPLAGGLFHKAIGESGAAFAGTPLTGSLEAEEKKDGDWVASLGVHSLAELRALPTAKILEASQNNLINGFPPYVDGRLLTEPVEATYAAGRQAHVPLLAGWNRDEYISLANGMTEKKWKVYAVEHFKERADEFLKLYPGVIDEQASWSAADYGSDAFIAFGTWKWIEAQRQTGASPVYRYHFELAAPPSKYHLVSTAFHSDEIEYVFGTLDTRPGAVWRPEDRKLSEQMMSYWTNFAKTGDPNGRGLPPWPMYGKDDSLIRLDSTITSGPDTLRARYEFLAKGMPEFRF